MTEKTLTPERTAIADWNGKEGEFAIIAAVYRLGQIARAALNDLSEGALKRQLQLLDEVRATYRIPGQINEAFVAMMGRPVDPGEKVVDLIAEYDRKAQKED